MAFKAICVPCGKPKKGPFLPCRACGFVPETEYQMARALIFSLEGIVGGVRVGRDAGTLERLSAQIQSGRFHEFDPREEQRAVEAWRAWKEQGARRRAWRRKIVVRVSALVAATALAVAGWHLFQAG